MQVEIEGGKNTFAKDCFSVRQRKISRNSVGYRQWWSLGEFANPWPEEVLTGTWPVKMTYFFSAVWKRKWVSSNNCVPPVTNCSNEFQAEKEHNYLHKWKWQGIKIHLPFWSANKASSILEQLRGKFIPHKSVWLSLNSESEKSEAYLEAIWCYSKIFLKKS